MKVSAFIITLNEEQHIERALTSLSTFDEVVVVDSGSTDKTIEICTKFSNCRVITQDWLGFSKQKQFALNLCANDWAFNLDADEEISPKVIADIEACLSSHQFVAASFPRREYFLGEITHPWVKNNRFTRLIKRSNAKYNEKLVHESLQVDGRTMESDAQFFHYGEQTLFIKITKLNSYARLRAMEKASNGKQASIIRMLLAPFLAFIKNYFLKRNVFMGKRGLIGSLIVAFYSFLKEANLYEINRENKQH